MFNLLKIAARNLRRYKRRSLLTVSLIAFGVVFVLVFVAVTASIKDFMIAQITDSYLGALQIHRGGYVASIESLPLNLNLATRRSVADRKNLGGYQRDRSLFGADKVRRPVQQFYRDHQYQDQRSISGKRVCCLAADALADF